MPHPAPTPAVCGVAAAVAVAAVRSVTEVRRGLNTPAAFGTALYATTPRFGGGVGVCGDWDGDGVRELAVGAPDAGDVSNAVYGVWMWRNGTMRSFVKWAGGMLPVTGWFGRAVACGFDLDGDGGEDVLVGSPVRSSFAGGVAAVWLSGARGVLRMAWVAPSASAPVADDEYGISVWVGGGSGGGMWEVVVGGDGRSGYVGAVWVMSVNGTSGAVGATVLVGGGSALPSSVVLQSGDRFGIAVAGVGDLDCDGGVDLAVGAYARSSNAGSVIVLLRGGGGAVVAAVEVAPPSGVTPAGSQWFGTAVAGLGDMWGDGVGDMAVGADGDPQDVWVVELSRSGAATGRRVRVAGGSLPGGASPSGAQFGVGVAGWGDVEGDGVVDLVVGAYQGRGGGANDGAVYVVWL